jgi:glycosyltransferase involved in cell wall biosynthesis
LIQPLNKNASHGCKTKHSQAILHLECATTYGGSVRCLENFLRFRTGDKYRHIVCLYTPFEEKNRLLPYCDDLMVAPQSQIRSAGRIKRAINLFHQVRNIGTWLYPKLKQFNVALVKLNNGPEAHLGALIAARLSRKPVVSWLRSMPIIGGNRWLWDWCIQQPQKLIAVSNAVRDSYIAEGVLSERITTIYDGIEIPENKVPVKKWNEPFRVGTLGRIVAWKGLMDVIKAAALLCDVNVIFEIAGNEDPSEPDFKKYLHTEIERMGLVGKVYLRGFIKEPKEFLRPLDCLLNPSFPAEPFGMSIIEAMAIGIPVIATNAGGPAEIIEHGHSGILVPPRSPTELAGAIRNLANNRILAGEIGQAARDRVRVNFDVKRLVREQEELLYEIAGRGQQRS